MVDIPLFLNIPSKKTIVKIGFEEVTTKIYGQVMVHVTVILWIFTDGTKLLPMSVFKGIYQEEELKNNQKIIC